jgi:hypothetical protein
MDGCAYFVEGTRPKKVLGIRRLHGPISKVIILPRPSHLIREKYYVTRMNARRSISQWNYETSTGAFVSSHTLAVERCRLGWMRLNVLELLLAPYGY